MSTSPELLAERTRLLAAHAVAVEEARTLDVIRALTDLDTLTYCLLAELEVLRFTGRVVEEDLTVVVDVYLEDLARATDALDLVVDRLTSALEAGRR